MRNKYMTYLATATILATVFVGCNENNATPTQTSKPLSLSIAHVNDVHSHLDSESMKLKLDGADTTVQIGGYARMKTKIDELQKTKKNMLTLNAGDALQGTLYYSLFKGEADAAMINTISWDAMTLGNHEFDDGDASLATFLSQLINVKNLISANVEVPTNSPLKGLWKPYFIKDFDGEKVGIIGIEIAEKTKNSSNPSKDVVFKDEVATAQKYIDELKAKGINKIVLLSHVGLEYDKEYASKLSGVDIIIGGDSHSLMGDFTSYGLKSQNATYPHETKDKNGNKVCISHAWEYAHAVGTLDVEFNKDGVVDSCKGNTVLMLGDEFKRKDATTGKDVVVDDVTKVKILDFIKTTKNIELVQEDSGVLSVLKSFKDKVDAKKAVKIGEATEKLNHIRVPNATYPLGSDIAPIVAKSFYDLSNLADGCIQNAGGVRVSVEAGDITMGTAYTLLPFANTLFEIKMYGNEVKDVLEDAVDAVITNKSTGSFPYAYGFKYDIDSTQAKGSRISNLESKNRATGIWSPIDNSKVYTVVTNSYTAGGKDGYTTFATVQEKRGAGVDTYLDYALSFVRYVEKNKNISKLPSVDHPIKSYK